MTNKMLFSVNDKLKVPREEKQYTERKFLVEFPNKKWSRGDLNHLLEKIDKFGCVERLAGTHNAENIESVHSQEDGPHCHCAI